MQSFHGNMPGLRGNALDCRAVWSAIPTMHTRSEMLDKLPLGPEAKERIAAARPKKPRVAGLLTIGYEGRSLENYLNELLRAGVTVLCGCAAQSLSRKYGFSKGTLSKAVRRGSASGTNICRSWGLLRANGKGLATRRIMTSCLQRMSAQRSRIRRMRWKKIRSAGFRQATAWR